MKRNNLANDSGVISFDLGQSFPLVKDKDSHFLAKAREDYNQQIADDLKIGKLLDSQAFVRWGKDNKLPTRLVSDMFNNPLSLGILYLKADMAFGGGLIPYRKINDKNRIVKEPIIDNEISDYLEAMDANETAERSLTDFYASGNFTNQIIAGKGILLASNPSNYIAQVVHTDVSTVRMGVKKKGQLEPSTHYINDWVNGRDSEKEAISAFDRNQVQRKCLYWGKKYVTGQAYYGVPQQIGGDRWTKQIAMVPDYILALMQNILAVRFIIRIPKDYWVKNNLLKNPNDKDELRQAMQKTIDDIREYLSGYAEAGKALAVFKENDTYRGIEIEAVKDETKYDAFLPNYQQGITAITNAFGVDPSLAGIKIEGKMTNAAEQHWAYRIFNLIRTPRLREKVCEPFNYALKINFPRVISEGISIGFENLVLEPLAENKTGVNSEQNMTETQTENQ